MSQEPRVQYSIHLESPKSHYITVDLFIPEAPADRFELKLPTWLPGAYKLNEFSANIEQFKASNGRQETVSWHKTDKLTWQVNANTGQPVRIQYKVYAFQLADDASYLSDDFAIINPGTICLAVIPLMESPCSLAVILPDHWKDIATGLPLADGENRRYRATDYHHLMDCPMLIGNLYLHRFIAGGIPHEVAIQGKGNLDFDQFLADLEKITACEIDMMQHIPYDRYVYLFLITDRDAGLEHCNSTLIFEHHFNFKPRKKYAEMISIFSHELYHAWNVKALRPQELVHPNYFTETYTDLLWVSEGFTNYYHYQFLLRPGVINLKEYIEAVTYQVTRYRRFPGFEYQSTAEASFDAWIKYYRQHENTPNSTISYYLKGSMIAFFLDLDILEATNGRHRLDDVMRELYQEHYVRKFDGFTYDDVVRTAEKYTGRKMDDFFRKFVYGTTDMPFESYFQKVGLELKAQDPDDDKMKKGNLGVRVTMREHRPHVSIVRRNSPAQDAGIQPNDEIVAMNGLRVFSDEGFTGRLEHMKPGDTVEIMLARQHEVKTVTAVLGEPVPVKYTAKPIKNSGDDQRRLFTMWTGGNIDDLREVPCPDA
ncbi:M61 family metallopeptidase [bacterium]|nr:M61 family metallopeptidase [candidate division CSSED10-310 bacterium]